MFDCDYDETLRFLESLYRPGAVFEVRAKRGKGAYGERFDDAERAATYATEQSKSPDTVAVWISANALDLLTPWPEDQKSMCDHNVTRRIHFFVDVDSTHPKDQNATDAELEAARSVMLSVVEYLTSLGFPPPLIVCTGNGFQVWYAIDLQGTDNLVEHVLGALSVKFNSLEATIDVSVSNAARVGRMVGTMNRKGPHTPDRPQRLATIVSVPDKMEVVSRKTLEKVCGPVPLPSVVDSTDEMAPPLFDVDGFLNKHNITFHKKQKDGGDVWEFDCIFKPGSRTGGGMWVFQDAGGTIRGGCHHEECKLKKRGWKAIRNKIDPTFDKAIKESLSDNVTDAEYLARRHLAAYPDSLILYHESVWEYEGGVYNERKPEAVKRSLRRTMMGEFARYGRMLKNRGMDVQPPSVSEKLVSSVYGVLTSIIPEIDRRFTAPCWLDGRAADNLVVCGNGILNLDTLTLAPHTFKLFSNTKLPYDYDPAATCPLWHEFILSIWPDDSDSISLVQECAGYTLLGANPLQSVFLLQGAKRGGKGVLIRTLCFMVGRENTCSISIRNFVKDFALWGARGKSIIVIPDVRAPKHGIPPEIVEILKAISGNDLIDVNGKNKDIVSEQLLGKVFASTNDLLTFDDDSGTIFDRLVCLKFVRSFLPPDHPEYVDGQTQDPDLERKLQDELPGILNWAIKGLHRVQAKKHFTQPASSVALKNELMEDGSPIKQFIADCLVRAPSGHVLVDDLFAAWALWCDAHSFDKGTVRSFGKLLFASCPWAKRQKVSSGPEPRPYEYRGLELRSNIPVM